MKRDLIIIDLMTGAAVILLTLAATASAQLTTAVYYPVERLSGGIHCPEAPNEWDLRLGLGGVKGPHGAYVGASFGSNMRGYFSARQDGPFQDVTSFHSDRISFDGEILSYDTCSYRMGDPILGGPYFPGDANQDGLFNSRDMISVFQQNCYGDRAVWPQGDWTVDLRFDSADLILAFQQGTYEQPAAVPESISGLWLLLILFLRRVH